MQALADKAGKCFRGWPANRRGQSLFPLLPCVRGHNMSKVLLVEDNEFNRDMLSRRLLRSGWDVMVAIDGRQGAKLACSEPVDVILMDMSSPEMNGWQVTELLKSDCRTREIPVIALTAHAMNGDREKALKAGCDEFETKPIEFGRLLEKMNHLVSQARRCDT
jgi:two-component system cell cycle response regulator DivK